MNREKNRSLIAIASLGGTITMTSEGSGGVRPTMNVQDLLDSVPALSEVADLATATLQTLPGASLTIQSVKDALQWARAATADGADGVILVQGTDTIEETSYLLDLYWDREEPLIVTGAMRSPQTPGSDGPANLLASAIVGVDPHSRGLGVLVVMNDEVHAASRVRKTRASGTDAFASPSFGPLGYVEERRTIYGNRPSRWPHLVQKTEQPDVNPAPRIALLEATLGDDDALLRLVTQARFDGVVLAGFGVGHLSQAMAKSVDEAIRVCPVVLASRAGAGTTLENAYSFEGSESDLIARGAIAAGWLDPRKARILLDSLLSAGYRLDDIRAEFARRGKRPGGASSSE